MSEPLSLSWEQYSSPGVVPASGALSPPCNLTSHFTPVKDCAAVYIQPPTQKDKYVLKSQCYIVRELSWSLHFPSPSINSTVTPFPSGCGDVVMSSTAEYKVIVLRGWRRPSGPNVLHHILNYWYVCCSGTICCSLHRISIICRLLHWPSCVIQLYTGCILKCIQRVCVGRGNQGSREEVSTEAKPSLKV